MGTDIRRFEQLVQSVAMFLIHSGAGSAKIRTSLVRALDRADKNSADAALLRDLYVAMSKVLHAWHQDPRYLDEEARPLPLKIRGTHLSLEALAKQAATGVPLATLVRSLRSQNLLRSYSKHRVLPTRSVAKISKAGPELTGYVGQSILQLISTLHFNSKGSKRGPLLERAAIVQDLPYQEIEHFRRYSIEQGAAFVSSTNRWLESRRKKRRNRGRPVVTAGVHVFAFVTPAPRPPKR